MEQESQAATATAAERSTALAAELESARNELAGLQARLETTLQLAADRAAEVKEKVVALSNLQEEYLKVRT